MALLGIKRIGKKYLVGALAIAVAMLAFAFVPKMNEGNSENNVVKEGGIEFMEPNWSKVLSEAKKQDKLIFVDAYTTWCGPCKLLKKNTFPDKGAGEFFNKNYINVAVDMEMGDGPSLGEKYGVNAYPTLLIVDPDGKLVTYTIGYIGPKQLIEFGKYGLKQRK